MASRKPRLIGNPSIDAERADAELTLAEITRGIEGRFERVLVHEPSAYVSVATLRLAAPAGRGPNDAPINENIPFVRITSDIAKEGELGILWPTAALALTGWQTNMDKYLAGRFGAKTLFWRVKPEIDYDRSFETKKHGWKVYSRLAVH